MEAKKEIKKIRQYIVTEIEYVDGTVKLGRENDGFTSIELLGLFSYIKSDILEQMAGKIHPDIVERQVIVDKK